MKTFIRPVIALTFAAVAAGLSACNDNNDNYPVITPPEQTKSLYQTVLDEIRLRTSEIALPKAINDLLFSDEPDSETALPAPVTNN